jgi:hypothetical protein
VRHRSRNPQQPKRSRYTDEARSLTWYRYSRYARDGERAWNLDRVTVYEQVASA